MTPQEVGEKFAYNDAIEAIHKAIAVKGQTDAPEEGDDVDYHFICYTMSNNQIYELDGMQSIPISKGMSNEENFVNDVANIIKKEHMSTDDINFSIVTLVSAEEL